MVVLPPCVTDLRSSVVVWNSFPSLVRSEPFFFLSLSAMFGLWRKLVGVASRLRGYLSSLARRTPATPPRTSSAVPREEAAVSSWSATAAQLVRYAAIAWLVAAVALVALLMLVAVACMIVFSSVAGATAVRLWVLSELPGSASIDVPLHFQRVPHAPSSDAVAVGGTRADAACSGAPSSSGQATWSFVVPCFHDPDGPRDIDTRLQETMAAWHEKLSSEDPPPAASPTSASPSDSSASLVAKLDVMAKRVFTLREEEEPAVVKTTMTSASGAAHTRSDLVVLPATTNVLRVGPYTFHNGLFLPSAHRHLRFSGAHAFDVHIDLVLANSYVSGGSQKYDCQLDEEAPAVINVGADVLAFIDEGPLGNARRSPLDAGLRPIATGGASVTMKPRSRWLLRVLDTLLFLPMMLFDYDGHHRTIVSVTLFSGFAPGPFVQSLLRLVSGSIHADLPWAARNRECAERRLVVHGARLRVTAEPTGGAAWWLYHYPWITFCALSVVLGAFQVATFFGVITVLAGLAGYLYVQYFGNTGSLPHAKPPSRSPVRQPVARQAEVTASVAAARHPQPFVAVSAAVGAAAAGVSPDRSSAAAAALMKRVHFDGAAADAGSGGRGSQVKRRGGGGGLPAAAPLVVNMEPPPGSPPGSAAAPLTTVGRASNVDGDGGSREEEASVVSSATVDTSRVTGAKQPRNPAMASSGAGLRRRLSHVPSGQEATAAPPA